MNRTDRVVIVGGGIAALCAALTLAPRPVLVITPETLGQGASSAWAQGGVAAAMGQGDAPALHLADTIRAGAGLVDARVADLVTTEAPELITALAALGAPFDRDLLGGYVLSREAAHGRPRVVRVGGDRAGAAIMATLIGAVEKASHIQVMTGLLVTGLVTNQGRVIGVTVEGAAGQGELHSPAVILAGGGAAGLYAVTTNPNRIRGQMLGMAARAGAVIRDAEFVQFHPTAIDTGEDPAPLATEALRGEGAVLLNNLGQRFMQPIAPEAELAPRDIVARAVYTETAAGRRPVLDTRQAIGANLPDHFPTVHAACLRAGIDPVTQPIPVTAAAHYHMGGIAVDGQGRSSLPGLWVCGEAACTGLHGANRLASNGLLEALVFGRRVGRDVAASIPQQQDAPAQITLSGQTQPPDDAEMSHLRRLMTDHVGVVRDATGLRRALAGIAALDRPDQPAAMANMLAAATTIAAAALLRRESRGAHCRQDFPATAVQAQPSHLTWQQAQMLRADAVMES
jgi:L-aspartate oxidase